MTLVISLAFNVGFIFIFAYFSYYKPKPSIQRPSRNPRIHEVFRSEAMQAARSENNLLRKEFFTELAKPEVDYDKVNELIVDLEESQRILEHTILHNFIKIRNEISAEEAESIFTSFQNRHDSNRHNRKKNKDFQNPENRRDK